MRFVFGWKTGGSTAYVQLLTNDTIVGRLFQVGVHIALLPRSHLSKIGFSLMLSRFPRGLVWFLISVTFLASSFCSGSLLRGRLLAFGVVLRPVF